MADEENLRKQQDMMYIELKKVNEMIFRSFKKCVTSTHNKILAPKEKSCIRDYLQKERNFQEELIQALSKANSRRSMEEINSIRQNFK